VGVGIGLHRFQRATAHPPAYPRPRAVLVVVSVPGGKKVLVVVFLPFLLLQG